MEMATASEEEEQILKCGICLGLLNEPKVLECRHVFCKDCITQHFNRIGKNAAPCPICRELHFPLTRKPVTFLSCPIVLCQLLQVKQKPNQKCESETCLDDSGCFICLKCMKWLCYSCKTLACSKDIDDPLSNRNHDAHRPSDVPPVLRDIVIQSRSKVCKEHRDHEVQWFCTKCEKLVCQNCRTYSHSHHDITDITELHIERCNILKTWIQQLKEKEQEHKHISQVFQNLLLNFNSKMSETKTSKWQQLMEDYNNYAEECDCLVTFITHLIIHGSCHVIVNTFVDVEKQVDAILSKSGNDLLVAERQFAEKYLDVLHHPCQTREHANIPHQQLAQGEYDEDSRSENSDKSIDQTGSKRTASKDDLDSLLCQMPGCPGEIACCICKVCKQWLCKLCQEKKCNLTQKHKTVYLEALSSFLRGVIKTGRNDRCIIHPHKQERHYCNTCEKLTCDDCRKDKHGSHDICGIDVYARNLRYILKEKMDNLLENQKSVKIAEKKFRNLHEESAEGVLNPAFVQGALDSCIQSIDEYDVTVCKITDLLQFASNRCVVVAFPEVDNSINDCINSSAGLQNSQDRIKLACATFNKTMESLEQSARSPNTSEEGNTAAHISWIKSLCDLFKWLLDSFKGFFPAKSKFPSGSG